MVEQTKRSGWFRCLFRGIFVVVKWLFVAVLVILLVAGLFFHGPPKVLLLIAIFLASLTILPKRFRKWFWCCFGAVAVILIIWVFLPDNNEGWKPYTLDEEIAQLEAKYAVADEDNAALVYNRLIDTYDPNDTDTTFMDDDTDFLTSSQPWLTEDHPQVAEWLKIHEETIAILTEAAGKEKCRFPFSTNHEDFGKMMDRFSPMKHWAELLVFAINNDIGDGRGEQALEKNIVLFQMGQHIYQQTTLIDLLVGIAVDALSMKQFKIFIMAGDPTESQLDLIDKKLTESAYNWSVDFRQILEGENLLSKNTLLGTLYEVDSNGNTRFNRDQISQFSRDLQMGYFYKKAFKAYTIFAWLCMPTDPQEIVGIINTAQKDLDAITEDDFEEEKETEPFAFWSMELNYRGVIEMLNSIMEPSFQRVYELCLRANSCNQATRIIVALKRYERANGTWLASLEEIKNSANENIFVDPINGSDYVYRLTEENFTLYSTGQNKIDEQGERNTTWDPNTSYFPTEKEDDMLYWPRQQKKRQMLMPGAPGK
jgi:hypothetical protein